MPANLEIAEVMFSGGEARRARQVLSGESWEASMEHDDFSVEVESSATEIVVRLRGELDAMTVHILSDQLPAAIVRHDERPVAFDFAELQFIDASGLGILVNANTSLGLDGRRLEIRNPSKFVMRLFGITGLDRILKCSEV
jgi:anti-anti-sigma factor